MTPDSSQGRAPLPDPDHETYAITPIPNTVPAHADNGRPRHRVSRSRAAGKPIVTGLLIVNLGGRGAWPAVADVRQRMWAIESLRPGARCQVHVADVVPVPTMIDGLRLNHVDIEVVSSSPETIDRWVDLLRGVNG